MGFLAILVVWFLKAQSLGVVAPNIDQVPSDEFDQLKIDDKVSLIKQLVKDHKNDRVYRIIQRWVNEGQEWISRYSDVTKALLDIGKSKDAVELLKQVTKLKPDDHQAFELLAEALLIHRPKNIFEARMIYEDLHNKQPKNPRYVYRLCELFIQEGLLEEAHQFCEKASKSQAYADLAKVQLGWILYWRQQWDAGDLYMEELAKTGLQDPKAINLLIQYFEKRQKPQKAVKALEILLPHISKNADILINAALISCQQRMYQNCYLFLEKICQHHEKKQFEKKLQRIQNHALSSDSPRDKAKFSALFQKCL